MEAAYVAALARGKKGRAWKASGHPSLWSGAGLVPVLPLAPTKHALHVCLFGGQQHLPPAGIHLQ